MWGVLFLLLGLFTLASLVFFHPEDLAFYTSHPTRPIENYTGITGAYLGFGLFLTFGISAFLIPTLFLLWSGCFFLQKVPEKKVFQFIGLGMALFSMATLVALSVSHNARFDQGGVIGYIAGSHLLRYFGLVGSYILAGACLLLSLLLATDFLIYPLVKKLFKNLHSGASGILETAEPFKDRMFESIQSLRDKEDEKPARRGGREKEKEKEKVKEHQLPEIPLKVKKYEPHVVEAAEKLKAEAAREQAANLPQAPAEKRQRKSKPDSAEVLSGSEDKKFEGVIGSKADEGKYTLPSVDFLKRPSAAARQTDDLQANSRIIEQTLAEFGIEVKVVEVEQGPVITRYELLPAPGVKLGSISALQDNLALAMKAASIRLIIPIPGKSAVGVEVPNSVSNVVSLREMIETREFASRKCALPLVLGKTTSGKPMVVDLQKMPHILIAGSTGSGKTVCVNSIIMGLLYHTTPDQLKFVMVDPKMVEMAVYNKIPHMLTPVVTDIKKAAHTLNWVVNEMENRYKLFATCGVRNIQAFNERPLSEETQAEIEAAGESENVVPAKLPYIIVIIDELADLMISARDKVEASILRLAQLARATGIHLILATQRPSVDVITGVIKANFPARLSFKVSSKVDSRTVLDANGADQLIGRGDLLFIQPGEFKPIRGQAPLVSDEEINTVVDFWSQQGNPEFHPEIQKAQENRVGAAGTEEKDELFEEAVKVVMETRQASTSNLQRRLRLGYTRAARIIDQMEAAGLIGPAQGAKPRDIYLGQENSQPIESQ